MVAQETLNLLVQVRFLYPLPRNMEDDAAGLVRRPALKTGFSEMGWGSTPLLSARYIDVAHQVEHRTENSGVVGSSPTVGTKLIPLVAQW